MRLIDADKLKRLKVKTIQDGIACDSIVVYSSLIDKAETYKPRSKVITSDENTIKADWLLKKLFDLVYQREIDGSVVTIFQRLMAEWKEENHEQV